MPSPISAHPLIAREHVRWCECAPWTTTRASKTVITSTASVLGRNLFNDCNCCQGICDSPLNCCTRLARIFLAPSLSDQEYSYGCLTYFRQFRNQGRQSVCSFLQRYTLAQYLAPRKGVKRAWRAPEATHPSNKAHRKIQSN